MTLTDPPPIMEFSIFFNFFLNPSLSEVLQSARQSPVTARVCTALLLSSCHWELELRLRDQLQETNFMSGVCRMITVLELKQLPQTGSTPLRLSKCHDILLIDITYQIIEHIYQLVQYQWSYNRKKIKNQVWKTQIWCNQKNN